MGRTNRILDGLREALAHASGAQTRVRVTTWQSKRRLDVKALRSGLGLSQSVFARRFGFNLATLRQWEQGRRYPDGPARVLLRVIALNPKVVERAVSEPAPQGGVRPRGLAADALRMKLGSALRQLGSESNFSSQLPTDPLAPPTRPSLMHPVKLGSE